ncbi:hypothetical protein KIL84_002160, partial [Mauremys mutica]
MQHQAQTSGQGVSGCRVAILHCAGQQQTVVSVLPLGKGSMAQGLILTLWVWILRSTLVLLLLVSAPIITCILRKRAIAQPIQKAVGGNGREEEMNGFRGRSMKMEESLNPPYGDCTGASG